MLTHAASKDEIQTRVRRGYLERLDLRLKKMRRFLSDREWNQLRIECMHLKNTAASFDFQEIARLALDTENSIPRDAHSSALHLPEARQKAETLFSEIEHAIARTQATL